MDLFSSSHIEVLVPLESNLKEHHIPDKILSTRILFKALWQGGTLEVLGRGLAIVILSFEMRKN